MGEVWERAVVLIGCKAHAVCQGQWGEQANTLRALNIVLRNKDSSLGHGSHWSLFKGALHYQVCISEIRPYESVKIWLAHSYWFSGTKNCRPLSGSFFPCLPPGLLFQLPHHSFKKPFCSHSSEWEHELASSLLSFLPWWICQTAGPGATRYGSRACLPFYLDPAHPCFLLQLRKSPGNSLQIWNGTF